MTQTILSTELKGVPIFKRGKVRDVYDLGDKLLIVSTDRISAFDVVMPNGIPYKGRVLTALSAFWFDYISDIVESHLISYNIDEIIGYDERLAPHKHILEGRSMLVKKAKAVLVECVVRGYLAGSGWKEYKNKGSICGIPLPAGLKEADRLPEPIFTPATKAESGHDINITKEETANIVGKDTFNILREKSLAIYIKASEYARSKGIVISDTKFEFGKLDDEIILIDEVLTPDSSRFWPEDDYEPGRPQRSFDKQFVRDYLETLDWDKTPPAPELPEEIVTKTTQKYLKAHEMLTGKRF